MEQKVFFQRLDRVSIDRPAAFPRRPRLLAPLRFRFRFWSAPRRRVHPAPFSVGVRGSCGLWGHRRVPIGSSSHHWQWHWHWRFFFLNMTTTVFTSQLSVYNSLTYLRAYGIYTLTAVINQCSLLDIKRYASWFFYTSFFSLSTEKDISSRMFTSSGHSLSGALGYTQSIWLKSIFCVDLR